MVEERRFREDLYYRINVIRIELPPLRARGDDVLLLAQHFLEQLRARAPRSASAGSPPRRPRSCSRYAWPGNVRELQNCIERAVALTRFEELTVDDLPEKIRNYQRARTSCSPATIRRSCCRWRRSSAATSCACWRRSAATRTRAAEVLGLDRKTLYRKLERYGVSEED